uniref:Uncharacterized protein n=1 Tax=Anguilla anguilla TaxID=7936 RepID=A0A0E9U4J1_ANGAN
MVSKLQCIKQGIFSFSHFCTKNSNSSNKKIHDFT